MGMDMTRIKDLEVFQHEIYEIYYRGKLFNYSLLPKLVKQDHEIVNRLPHIVAVMVQNAIDGCYDHIDDLETYFSGKRLELQKIRDGK